MSRFRVNKLKPRERDILLGMVTKIVDDDLQSKDGSRRELWVSAIVGGLTAKTRLEMVADNGYLEDRDTVMLRLRLDPLTGIRFPEFNSRAAFHEFFLANGLELGNRFQDPSLPLSSYQREEMMRTVWAWVRLRRDAQEQ